MHMTGLTVGGGGESSYLLIGRGKIASTWNDVNFPLIGILLNILVTDLTQKNIL